ncbi:MAG: FkbM family methyltransferase [Flavobacteriales bacterium]
MAGIFSTTRVKFIKGIIEFSERHVFERRLQLYNRLLAGPPTTVIDVGANNGQTIEFFLRMAPNCTVLAFEPNKKLYDHLCATYKANPNIHLYDLGVSDSKGERTFNEDLLDYTSTFEDLNMDSATCKEIEGVGRGITDIVTARYTVHTTMADHISEHVQGTIDVIKIDVEGHEFACLQGLFNSGRAFPIRYLQLENHNDDMYANKTSFADIDALLKANGFTLVATVKHGFGDLDELIYGNTKYPTN